MICQSPKRSSCAGSARWKVRPIATPFTEGDYDRLRALVLGQTVSTGDEFEIFEIIEIVPPDEPALVGDETIVEFT